MESENSSNLLLDKAIMLSAITFAGYASAYIYFFSYYSYFKVPYYLIELNVTSILTAIFTVTVSLYFLGTFILPFIRSIIKNYLIFGIFWYTIFFSALWYIIGINIFGIITALIIVGIDLILPFIVYRKETIDTNSKIDKFYKEHTRPFLLLNYIPEKYKSSIILMLISIILVPYFLGYFFAKNRVNFYYVNTPEIKNDILMVIGSYKDSYICKDGIIKNNQIKFTDTELIPMQNTRLYRKEFVIADNNKNTKTIQPTRSVTK